MTGVYFYLLWLTDISILNSFQMDFFSADSFSDFRLIAHATYPVIQTFTTIYFRDAFFT